MSAHALLGASSARAVSKCPSWLSVYSCVASALIVGSAGAVAITTIRASSIDERQGGKRQKDFEHDERHILFDFEWENRFVRENRMPVSVSMGVIS